MNQANNLARKQAASAKVRMLLVILICGIMAVAFSFLTRTWVLRPINRLIDSVGEVSAGNLELVLHSDSNDEIGKLAGAFNHMTQALRERRRSDEYHPATYPAGNEGSDISFVDSHSITDAQGMIEISTVTAQNTLWLKTGGSVFNTTYAWLPELFRQAITESRVVEYSS